MEEEQEEEGQPPPPRPRPSAPPSLPDEIVEEIFLRFPADDPASLVRPALICKRWSRMASDPAFRRRFRDRPGPGAPMMGFLRNDLSLHTSARFVRTVVASCPPPLADRCGSHALDARAGRVLLLNRDAHTSRRHSFHHHHAVPPDQIRLAVWDPLAGGGFHRDLLVPALPRRPYSWNAALLCDDHLMDGPFRVVVVGTDADAAEGTFACVYSSAAEAWSQPAYAPGPGPDDHVDVVASAALVGNALYFVFRFRTRTRVLRYDLGTRDMSLVHLPPACHNKRIVLTTTATLLALNILLEKRRVYKKAPFA